MKYRIESDSMGEVNVPREALWGAQTQRALENFKISDKRIPRPLIRALGLLKELSAKTNKELEILDPKMADAIIEASREVEKGLLDEHFPVDVFQTGSGTSSNMNANEVIANRAAQILGESLGSKQIHPNDHVNLGQSSNDIFPSAIHIACYCRVKESLLPSLEKLKKDLNSKSTEFKDIVKVGRTHLQDALPISLGQVFSGYESLIKSAIDEINNALEFISELALGGTAIGTGLNSHKDFAPNVIDNITKKTSFPFKQASNLFDALSSRRGLATLSSSLKNTAVSITKIANDIRWLSSGPNAGIGEIKIPALQPGSSIMPGKVNPVIPEAVLQVCAQVIANDTAVSIGAMSSNFELNVMMPLIAINILESLDILANATEIFSEKCIVGIEANVEKCKQMVEGTLMLVTNLTKKIGYDKAAQIAKEAYETNKPLREVLKSKDLFSGEELETLLDPLSMIEK